MQKNRLLFAVMLFVSASVCCATDRIPRVLPSEPSCRALAILANEFIELGEVDGQQRLEALAHQIESAPFQGMDLYAHFAWLCRVLFVSRDGSPIRPARFGGLNLPEGFLDSGDWPDIPLAESDGVFFVLASDYILSGVPEAPSKYLKHCLERGVFRRDRVIVPDRDVAIAALDRLTKSERWKRIQWPIPEADYLGFGPEEAVLMFLRRQTEANQALQTTPTTRSVYGRAIEFGDPQRGV